jgi:hypothetical protein
MSKRDREVWGIICLKCDAQYASFIAECPECRDLRVKMMFDRADEAKTTKTDVIPLRREEKNSCNTTSSMEKIKSNTEVVLVRG